jgi:hypothetical protein
MNSAALNAIMTGHPLITPSPFSVFFSQHQRLAEDKLMV